MADAFFSFFVLLPLVLLPFLYFLVRPRPVKIPINNRHVFITGGSSGIGLALAHRAAAEGARVSIMARSPKKLEEAKSAVKQATGVEMAVFAADVRDYEAVKKAVDEAGPIDVLLLNHGVFYALELEKMELSDVKFTMDVNLMGCLNMIKAVLPSMKTRKDPLPASIALVSSQAGQVRKIATLEVLSTQRIEMLKHVMESEVKAAMKESYDFWVKTNNEGGKAVTEMKKWFGDIALNVLFRMVIGKRLVGVGCDGDEEENERIRKAVREFFELSGSFVVSDVLPFLRWFDLDGKEKEMKKVAKELDEFVQVWLDQHKRNRDRRSEEGELEVINRDFIAGREALKQSESLFGLNRIQK